MVNERANQLGEAIANSPEFKDFIDARAKLEEDIDAVSLLEEYSSKYQLVELNRQYDGPDSEDLEMLERELNQINDKMTENSSISRLAETQNAFQSLMNNVNKIIGEHIGLGGGCSGDCSDGCNGCH